MQNLHRPVYSTYLVIIPIMSLLPNQGDIPNDVDRNKNIAIRGIPCQWLPGDTPYTINDMPCWYIFSVYSTRIPYNIPYMQESTHAPYGQKSAQLDCSRDINLMIGKLEKVVFTNVETIKDNYKLYFFYLRLLYYFFFCRY